MNRVAIIIPTFNNLDMMSRCLNSLFQTTGHDLIRPVVINNGDAALRTYLPIKNEENFVQMEKNMGWTNALKVGVERTTEPFLLFLNDDTQFIPSDTNWLPKLLSPFDDPSVGAVGPMSNCASGHQNMFIADVSYELMAVQYLIGFCLLVRRSALIKAGGIDPTGPGADDIDLSIRLRKAGYHLLTHRSVFVFHHGLVTGKKVHGDGWYGEKSTDRSNNWLIRKHGVKEFALTVQNQAHPYFSPNRKVHQIAAGGENPEKTICASLVVDKESPIFDVGCGADKTLPEAMGLDVVGHGQPIPQLNGAASQADLCCDGAQCIPCPEGTAGTIIARHILEHCVDTLQTLDLWRRAVKPGGRLIIAVPDHRLGNTIVLNPEHVHGFTPQSLLSLGASIGLKPVLIQEGFNGVSFIVCFERPVPVAVERNGHAAEPVVFTGSLS